MEEYKMGKKESIKLTTEEKKKIVDIYRLSSEEACYFFDLLASREVALPDAVCALAELNTIFIERLALFVEEEDRENLKQDIVYRLKAGLDFFISNKPLPKNV